MVRLAHCKTINDQGFRRDLRSRNPAELRTRDRVGVFAPLYMLMSVNILGNGFVFQQRIEL